MSRHHRHVPTSFYRRFAKDTRKFADRYARGRLISVLEGGYSDRALTSGAMAHLAGLAETDGTTVDESWWSLNNIIEVRSSACVLSGGSDALYDIARESDEEAAGRARLPAHRVCALASPYCGGVRGHRLLAPRAPDHVRTQRGSAVLPSAPREEDPQRGRRAEAGPASNETECEED